MKTWIWNHFNLSFKAKDLLSLACWAAGGSHMSLNCLISPSSQELFLATSRNILLLSSAKLRAPSKALSPKTLLDSCVHCFFICEKRRIKNKEMAKLFLWGNENKKDKRKWSKSENVFSYCRGLFSVVLALFATNLSQYVYVSMNACLYGIQRKEQIHERTWKETWKESYQRVFSFSVQTQKLYTTQNMGALDL